ncbi:MAG: hypothetical protein CMO74_14390 [Verrucomicrobiales bacterium]|nr:hypothetical protein [Verrucomicrobiales bacterium]|tara:strand:- start:77070 stop:77642 length:573 start_codon:yes stop_codon:yes gene_type:complete
MKISSNKSLIKEIAPGVFSIGNNPFAPAFLLDANTQKASVSGVEVVLDGDLQHLFDELNLVDEKHTTDIQTNADAISSEATRANTAESAIQSEVDQNSSKLANIEDNANNYVHPNHSGEVSSTSDGATIISDNVVDEANLKVSNPPSDGYMLTAQSSASGGLVWVSPTTGGGLSEAEVKAIAFRSAIIFG